MLNNATCFGCSKFGVVNNRGYCEECFTECDKELEDFRDSYLKFGAAADPAVCYQQGYWHGVAIGVAGGSIVGLVIAVIVYSHVMGL